MRGPGAAGGNDIQQGQLACLVVDGESADAAGFLPLVFGNFIHRVKVSVRGINGEEARIVGFRRQPERRKLSRRCNHLININPLAFRPGIGANVNKFVDFAEIRDGAARVQHP